MSFYSSVKSTIDKLGMDLVSSLPEVNVGVNLDAIEDFEQFIASTNPAIVWKLISLEESPRRPLYQLTFAIGAKTTGDLSGQVMTDLISAVQDSLENGTWVDIKDYSGTAVPTDREGSLIIKSAGVDEQETDKVSGLRMLLLSAGVVRDV